MRLCNRIVVVAALACCSIGAAADGPAFPLRSSTDGRYLMDAKNQPFFYQADTAWALTKRFGPEDVRAYLDNAKQSGFTAVQVHTLSKEVSPVRNSAGELPFDESEDILKPNEKYWKNVDSVIDEAGKRGLLVSMAALWIRWGGRDKEGWRYHLTNENARTYGRFLGKRYRNAQNLIWIVGGDANPIERSHAVAEIARGIKEHAPHHLITVHNRPQYSSAAFFGNEPWLDVNMAYTYEEVYPHVLGEYFRVGKPRPIFLGESGYEKEANDGRPGTPFRMRKQAWQAVLSGALGGHTYGHREIWRLGPEWRQALTAPGRAQMRFVRELLVAYPWYKLVPDAYDKLLTGGRSWFGAEDYVTAAATPDGKLALAYLPAQTTLQVDLSRMNGPVRARWFDPTDGSWADADPRKLTSPARNSAGDADFVLVLETRQ